MDIESKIKEDMRLLGCSSELKITLAYHLYLHLVDEKLMYDTEYCYNKDIDTLYIVARRSKNEKMNIYVPIPTYDHISMEFINILQENLCTIETGPSISLAFTEGDSTTVIYTFTKGLVAKQPLEKTQQLRLREERRNFINNELKKKSKTFNEEVLNGGSVEDEDCQILE